MRRQKMITLSLVIALAYTGVIAQNTQPARLQTVADSLFAVPNFYEAKNVYQSLLKDAPKNSNNVLQLAACNMGLRLYDEAGKNIENYLSIEPKPLSAAHVQVNAALARIWSVRNNRQKGFEYLARAVDSGYARLDELDYETDFNTLRYDKKFIELRERTELNAFPCLSNPKMREFDFMIGEWDVYNNPSTGFTTLAGYNKWERISGGCAILENWTATGQPHNGKSINYYDPRTQTWEQVWVGSEGVGPIVQRFLKGAYDKQEKVMKFEYDVERPNGTRIRHRFRFFNLDQNTARQFKETSNDGGKTWAMNYDYLYKRKK